MKSAATTTDVRFTTHNAQCMYEPYNYYRHKADFQRQTVHGPHLAKHNEKFKSGIEPLASLPISLLFDDKVLAKHTWNLSYCECEAFSKKGL